MGNMINIIAVYVMISIMLYSANVTTKEGLAFGSDLITEWVITDSEGDISSVSTNFTGNANAAQNPFNNRGSTGTSFFNFWDALQMFWGFIKMIINIMIVIPTSLISLELPQFMKFGVVLPLLVIGTAIIILGMTNRR